MNYSISFVINIDRYGSYQPGLLNFRFVSDGNFRREEFVTLTQFRGVSLRMSHNHSKKKRREPGCLVILLAGVWVEISFRAYQA